MRKIILLVALAFSLSAHAEDLLPALRSCITYSGAGDYIAAAAARAKPNIVRNGVSYFKPRAGLTLDGTPVLALFAYGHGLAGSREDTYGYGVVVEGTTAFAHSLGLEAISSNISLEGHEFVEIGCYK